MSFELLLCRFIEKAREDPRIGPSHISLFLAIMISYRDQGFVSPVSVFGKSLMRLARISSPNTYHRGMAALKECGYIRYIPSYNPVLGSLVYLPDAEKFL